jgi:hypothetical protein
VLDPFICTPIVLSSDHLAPQIRSFLRKAVAVEIGITNPLDTPVEFRVQLDGEGLFGESQIALGARETRQYEFMYSPLVSGAQVHPRPLYPDEESSIDSLQPMAKTHSKKIIRFCMKSETDSEVFQILSLLTTALLSCFALTIFLDSQTGAVSFVNSRVGEFWYQLQLIGEKAPPTALPTMEAEVGRESSQVVVIENPSENEIEVRAGLCRMEGSHGTQNGEIFFIVIRFHHNISIQDFG